jgi:membrane-bound lytic murein transglycosylase D
LVFLLRNWLVNPGRSCLSKVLFCGLLGFVSGCQHLSPTRVNSTEEGVTASAQQPAPVVGLSQEESETQELNGIDDTQQDAVEHQHSICDHSGIYEKLQRYMQKPPIESESVLLGEVHGMPVVINQAVAKWIKSFTANDGSLLKTWLERGEPYRATIEDVLRTDEVPEVLFFIALIESGFVHKALSPKSASGPWQFMRGTARLYQLEMNEWVDERRDPMKATHAAARLLKNLHHEFNDWYLALAAYNAGPGRIKKALRSKGSLDYWRLQADKKLLRLETRDYVPKYLAAMLVGKNPQFFGLSWPAPAPHVDDHPYTYVELSHPVDVRILEKRAGLPSQAIRKWNPKLLTNVTPPSASKNKPFRMRVEKTFEPAILRQIANLPRIDIDFITMHRVSAGETLQGISRKYGVSQDKIKAQNPNLQPRRLRIGTQIAVPQRFRQELGEGS